MKQQYNGFDADDRSPDAQLAFLRYCHDHQFRAGLPFSGFTLIKLFNMAVGRKPDWVADADKCYEAPGRLIENLVHVAAIKLKSALDEDADLANVVSLQSARRRKLSPHGSL